MPPDDPGALTPAEGPPKRRRRRRKSTQARPEVTATQVGASSPTDPQARPSVHRPADPNSGRSKRRRRGRRPRQGGEAQGQAGSQGEALDQGVSEEPRPALGYLEMAGANGVLRDQALTTPRDPSVPAMLIRSLGLRPGDLVAGEAQGRSVTSVAQVNGHDPVDLAARPRWEDLTAVHPRTALVLGPTDAHITGRLLDLIAPVGRGQRGLIVSPPKAGKTTLLKDIASGLAMDPEVTIIAILVGERPEEVTELRREIKGTVLAADLDRPSSEHCRVAELGVEHAKRLAEEGRHVVILVDSLTRLARAYNLSLKGGGRTMSGGMDAEALHPVRRVFGAARATEEGGSLTILATCLIDTGSRMDDLVYEEFKGTGNMEVHLDRDLAQKRLFPAINIDRSGTRREELLLDRETLAKVTLIRRKLAGQPNDKALEALLGALARQQREARVEETGPPDPGSTTSDP